MHDHRTVARRDHMALILYALARRLGGSAPVGEVQRRGSLGLWWGPAFRAALHLRGTEAALLPIVTLGPHTAAAEGEGGRDVP
jgi:hypothetical protein